MFNRKKLLSLSLAVITAFTILPSTTAFACTTVLVGKKATTDGSTIMARNEDSDSANPKIVQVHEATTNPKGATFNSKVNDFSFELPKNARRYTSTPEWTDESGVYEEAGTNSSGVAMTATETISYNKKIERLDPVNEKDGIMEEAMVTCVLPYIKSAKDGVNFLGNIVTKYGSAELNGIGFSDQNDVWWMEIVSGHHWVAQRIPDNKYAVIANQTAIRDVDLTDAANFMCDENFIAFVRDNKLADNPEKLNIRDVFGTNNKDDAIYNICRVWDGQRILNPSTKNKYSITSKKLPFLRKPDSKISVHDVATVLRSHYNGTKYDPYTNAKSNYRPIMVQQTMESHIIQWRPNMPAEISGIQWQALGTPEHSIYIPLYSGITDVAPELKNAATADNPTYDNAYWIFKTTDVLSTPYYKTYMKKYVNPTFTTIEKQLDENIKASDEKAIELYKSNPTDKETLLNYLTEESKKNADYTLKKVIKLNNKMFIKSTNARNKMK